MANSSRYLLPASFAFLVAPGVLFLGACDAHRFGREFTAQMTLGGQTVEPAVLNAGREAYMHYCFACHGVDGDGRGPAAKGLRPAPRDFTRGIFKFGGVPAGELPSDEDLLRIVRHGLNGTAMLQWDVTDDELRRVIPYVKSLEVTNVERSNAALAFLREGTRSRTELERWASGQSIERTALDRLLDRLARDGLVEEQAGAHGASSFVVTAAGRTRQFRSKWATGRSQPPSTVPADPWGAARRDEAIALGKRLYHSSGMIQVGDRATVGVQCYSCHSAYATTAELVGFGLTQIRDGRYDSEAKDSEDYRARLLPPDFLRHPLRSVRSTRQHHEPPMPAATLETRALEDLYRVIASGVPGTAMPRWGGTIPNEDLWAIVHYVKSLTDLRDTPEGRELRERLLREPPMPAPPAEPSDPSAAPAGSPGP